LRSKQLIPGLDHAEFELIDGDVTTAMTLNEDRERRDFTINAVAQDVEGNFIDYQYVYRNKKISAITDIRNKQIRAIGNPKQRFEEDPLRILRGFRFMAQLGYEIEKQTMKAIENNLSLLEKIPHERIAMEMNKLILGKYATETLKLMKSIGVFTIKIHNSINNKPAVIMPGLNTFTDEQFDVLMKLNDSTSKLILGPLEVWTILLMPLGINEAKANLESIQVLNGNDIRKVEWLIEHFTLIDSEDMKNDLFHARTGIIKDQKLFCMRELIKYLCRIHTKMDVIKREKAEKLTHAFCSRPYFEEQLKIDGETMMQIANEKPGPWIGVAKEKLLEKLINTDKFPKEEEKYMELAQEAIEEALFERTMDEVKNKKKG
jgi:tRNA nucleotidyltransferase (CCA-adding enzyme)